MGGHTQLLTPRILEARREKLRLREASSKGAQLYYGSKVSLCSGHGMWLTVRDRTAYLSPEEQPGSALTVLNLKDPYSAGPVRYTDTILLQASDDLLLGTTLKVDRVHNRASYQLGCVGERGATHVGRWGLLHPDHLHGPVDDLKCMHGDKILLEQDWGLLCVDQDGVSMKEIMEPQLGQQPTIPENGSCIWSIHLRSSTLAKRQATGSGRGEALLHRAAAGIRSSASRRETRHKPGFILERQRAFAKHREGIFMAIDADRKKSWSRHLSNRRKAVRRRKWKPGLKQTKEDAAILFRQATPQYIGMFDTGSVELDEMTPRTPVTDTFSDLEDASSDGRRQFHDYRGHAIQETEQLRRARVLADTVAMEALIKRKAWATITKQPGDLNDLQNFVTAQAMVKLQRAWRRRRRDRWRRTFTREDRRLYDAVCKDSNSRAVKVAQQAVARMAGAAVLNVKPPAYGGSKKMSAAEIRMREAFAVAAELDERLAPPLGDEELENMSARRSMEAHTSRLSPSSRRSMASSAGVPALGLVDEDNAENGAGSDGGGAGSARDGKQTTRSTGSSGLSVTTAGGKGGLAGSGDEPRGFHGQPLSPARGGNGLGQWTVKAEATGSAVVFNATAGIRSFGSRHAGFVLRADAAPLTTTDSSHALNAQGVPVPDDGDSTGTEVVTVDGDDPMAAGGSAEGVGGADVVASGRVESESTSDHDHGAASSSMDESDRSIMERVALRTSGLALADDKRWTEEKSMILLHMHNPELFNLHLPKDLKAAAAARRLRGGRRSRGPTPTLSRRASTSVLSVTSSMTSPPTLLSHIMANGNARARHRPASAQPASRRGVMMRHASAPAAVALGERPASAHAMRSASAQRELLLASAQSQVLLDGELRRQARRSARATSSATLSSSPTRVRALPPREQQRHDPSTVQVGNVRGTPTPSPVPTSSPRVPSPPRIASLNQRPATACASTPPTNSASQRPASARPWGRHAAGSIALSRRRRQQHNHNQHHNQQRQQQPGADTGPRRRPSTASRRRRAQASTSRRRPTTASARRRSAAVAQLRVEQRPVSAPVRGSAGLLAMSRSGGGGAVNPAEDFAWQAARLRRAEAQRTTSRNRPWSGSSRRSRGRGSGGGRGWGEGIDLALPGTTAARQQLARQQQR